jgi:hypothetical protein
MNEAGASADTHNGKPERASVRAFRLKNSARIHQDVAGPIRYTVKKATKHRTNDRSDPPMTR